MEKAKISKKRTAIVAAVLCLALAAGLGTYAWLTAQSSLTNTFTVGSINNPDHKPDPTNPDQPGGGDWDVTGNLIETKWIDNSKLTLARAATTPTCSFTLRTRWSQQVRTLQIRRTSPSTMAGLLLRVRCRRMVPPVSI